MRKIAAAFGVPLCLLALSQAASAQTDPTKDVIAETLFHESKALMNAERFEEACRKLEHSYRLAPAGGTLLNWALCLEKWGKTASAWSKFSQALSLSAREGRADRAAAAREHMENLSPQLSKVVIFPERSDVTPKVELDGVELPMSAWETPIPVDLGLHKVAAKAPHFKTFDAQFEVTKPGQVIELTVPALQRERHLESGSSETSDRKKSDHSAEVSRNWKGWGLALTGVGVVAASVGAAFGISALSAKESADEFCGADSCRTHEGYSANETARTHARVANVMVGSGAVIAAVGLIIWLSDGKQKRSATSWNYLTW